MGNGIAAAMRKVRSGDLPLSGLVSKKDVQEACQEGGYRSRASLYTPITTILTFLAQLLGADGSCQQAVDGLIADRTVAGKRKCSADTAKLARDFPNVCFGILLANLDKLSKHRSTRLWPGKDTVFVWSMARR